MNITRRKKSWQAVARVALLLMAALLVNDQCLKLASRLNPASRVNWLFQSQPQEYEFAILGSSMLKEGLDPNQLSELTGGQVVQLAWGGRGVSEQALVWELFLERNRCHTLLLELHPRGLEHGVLTHPLDEFRYIGHLDSDIVRRHLTRQFGWLRPVLWRFLPMWAMAEFSTQIGWHDVLALRRGAVFLPNASADNRHRATAADLVKQRYNPRHLSAASEIDALALEQFREIVQLCHARQIAIVAIDPPRYQGRIADELPSLERYRELLGSQVEIFESKQIFVNDASCFQDAFHLNEQGSRLFTAELGTFLNKRAVINAGSSRF